MNTITNTESKSNPHQEMEKLEIVSPFDFFTEGYDNFTGSTNIPCELFANLTTYESGPYYDSNGIDLEVDQFNVTRVNMSLTEIIGNAYDLDINYGYDSYGKYELPRHGYLYQDTTYAMSFQIRNNVSGFINGFNASISIKTFTLKDITIYGTIYNATRIVNKVLPDAEQSGIEFSGVLAGNTGNGPRWIYLSSPGYYLNMSNTYNSTFFILLSFETQAFTTPDWAYLDQGTGGIACKGNTSQPWSTLNLDFGLKDIHIGVSYPKPSQINFTINGTPVSDNGKKLLSYSYKGLWINDSRVNPSQSGNIHFDLASNFTSGIRVYHRTRMRILNETYSRGFFITKWNNPTVDWNVTFSDIKYPELTSYAIYQKFVNVSLPISWNVTDVYNETNTPVPVPWENYTQNSKKIVYFGSSNGTYRLEGVDFNHLNTINVYNYTDNISYASYYMNDTLLVNSTYGITENGNCTLKIFSPTNISLNAYQKVAENNNSEFVWKINNDSNEEGVHYLRVTIKTPTEAGIKFWSSNFKRISTNLTLVTNSSFSVSPGTPVRISVFYNDTIHDDPIKNANVSSDWPAIYGDYNWEEFGGGYYNVTFFTGGAEPGKHNVTIEVFRAGFYNGTIQIEIDITGGSATYLNFVDFYYDDGEKNWSYPNPYWDDNKPIRIEYKEAGTGQGIIGATITAIPDWRSEPFQAIPQHGIEEGYYDIRIDTSGLSSFGNSSDIHYVNFTVSFPGYDSKSGSFFINVSKIPKQFLMLDTTGYDYLECYQGEQVEIACSFVDIYHENQPIVFDEINPGNVSWMIYNESNPGEFIIAPHVMGKVISIYQDTIKVNEYGLPAGTYNVTIQTSTIKNWVNFTKNITLHVKDNLNSTLTLNYSVSPGGVLRVGAEITITAHLTFENQSEPQGSQIQNASRVEIKLEHGNDTLHLLTNENGTADFILELSNYDLINNFTVNVSYDGTAQIDATFNDSLTNLTVLPKQNVTLSLGVSTSEILVGDTIQVTVGLFIEGTTTPLENRTVAVVVKFFGIALDDIVEYGITGSNGYAIFQILIPLEAGGGLTPVTIEIHAEFKGEKTIQNGVSSFVGNIKVQTIGKIFLENLWWILIIIGAIVGALIYYQKGVRIPRKNRLIATQKKIAQSIVDSQNIVHLMIIMKDSGQSLYNQSFGESRINADLISGFLTAISAFQGEIRVKKKKVEEQKGFELSYAEFKILVMNGFYINVALILKDRPSDTLKQSLSLFITKFEQKFYNELQDWDGAIKPFSNTNELIEKVLNTRYQNPFTIESYKIKELNPLEQVICLIAEHYQENKGYFYVQNIIERIINTRPEPKYEVLYYINSLIQQQVFKMRDQKFVEELEEKRRIESNIQQVEETKPVITSDLPSAPSEVVEGKLSAKESLIEEVGIRGISDSDYEDLLKEMETMSPASRTILKKRILSSGETDDERIKVLVKNILKDRKKMKKLIENLINKASALETKEKYYDAYKIRVEVKEALEELGEEEDATVISQQIYSDLKKFDSENEIKILKIKAKEFIKKAELAISSQKTDEGALLYRKAARIYLEIGDDEEAEKFSRLAELADQN
ncbi:MAG: hypothetical protein ACTSVY_12195 [Candidatus Helarchaeota archaeon]